MPQDATAPARPAPETMLGVIPYLNLDGRAAEAAEFYARAFGATDLGRVPDAQNPAIQMHVQVEINGNRHLTCNMDGQTLHSTLLAFQFP